MTKLCCFKRNSPAVLTLSKVASTNNREESVSSVARVNVLTNSSTDFHALSQPLSKTRHNLVHWTFWQIITETSVLFDMTLKRITTKIINSFNSLQLKPIRHSDVTIALSW